MGTADPNPNHHGCVANTCPVEATLYSLTYLLQKIKFYFCLFEGDRSSRKVHKGTQNTDVYIRVSLFPNSAILFSQFLKLYLLNFLKMLICWTPFGMTKMQLLMGSGEMAQE